VIKVGLVRRTVGLYREGHINSGYFIAAPSIWAQFGRRNVERGMPRFPRRANNCWELVLPRASASVPVRPLQTLHLPACGLHAVDKPLDCLGGRGTDVERRFRRYAGLVKGHG
jgi:hypothetical protein